MTQPAPYCPETLRRIRDLAVTHSIAGIAVDLGWSKSMVQDVARRHGIEVAGTSLAKPRPVAPARVEDHIFTDGLAIVGECVDRCGIRAKLDASSMRVFDTLFRAALRHPEEWVHGRVLAAIFDVQSSTIGRYVSALRNMVKPLRLGIEGHRGKGYRLVDLTKIESEAS